MTIFYVVISILSFGELIHSLPRNSDLPQYTANQVHHFRPTVATALEEQEDIQTAASQQRSSSYVDNPYLYQNAIPVKQKVQLREPNQQLGGRPKNQPQQFRPAPTESAREKDPKQLEEEEEIEEPDRLSLLLPQSKFICNNKNTGYYADEDLGCEVFHYCQDNARHSWICPEGFTFHQVHLICMPPGGDNICEKSSQFHFVNEYLYKPVNLEEYQQKPNVSLRYSERFYPQTYYENRGEDEEGEARQHTHHRNSVRVPQENVPVPKALLVDHVSRATFRPETTAAVFRSSNEVNIPLQQRRPQYVTQRFFSRK